MSHSGALRPPVDDPDPTDRLPGLDPDAVDAGDDPLESTGTWEAPGPDGAAGQAGWSRQLEERDEAIAELTSLLREKAFALTRVEKELEHTRSELLSARRAGSHGAEAEDRLRDVEKERLALAAQHDEQRTAIARLEDQLSEAREAEQGLERRLERMRAEMTAAEDARATAATRLEEVEAQLQRASRETLTAMQQQEQSRLKERITELRNALTVAREELQAAQQDRDRLQAQLASREADVAAGRDALRNKALQAESLLERLRSREARGRIAADMRHVAGDPARQDERVAWMERALAAERETRRQLEEQLAAAGTPPPPEAQPADAVPGETRRGLTRLDAGTGVVQVLTQSRTTIGRTPDNDLQIRESYISRTHAVIRLGPDSAVIEDLDSRNGIYVNDRRVTREVLHDGDVVTLGKARFRFHAGSGLPS